MDRNGGGLTEKVRNFYNDKILRLYNKKRLKRVKEEFQLGAGVLLGILGIVAIISIVPDIQSGDVTSLSGTFVAFIIAAVFVAVAFAFLKNIFDW